eukprot:CAMPEP_0197024666 /NCGR_PEP_ID=MMETSP1384-20130603/5172_1 /TAXON_ID=29189 /ORGANISM="Ammonia sp." /LENGTH=623 /DNA_ID=CAMNT_0042453087 /DNA_START=1 /DNA_END=1872 /DNA_ORIENTATION=-
MSASCKDHQPLQRVIKSLQFHLKNEDTRKLTPYVEKEHAALLDDYVLIFQQLLNGDINANNTVFEEIHNLVTKACGKTEAKDSAPLKRFYDAQNEQKLKGDKTAKFYSNLLDSIYVYFMHSYELGYKVKGKQYNVNPINYDDEKNVNDTDQEITNLKAYLKAQQAKLKDVIPNYLNENKADDDEKQNYDHFEYYSYGTRYNYWLRGNNQMFSNKKFDKLKDELLNNAVYKFDLESYKTLSTKATLFKGCNEVKKLKANNDHETDWYIVGGEPLEFEHLMVLIICSDYSRAFKAFTAVIQGDAEEEEERARNFEIYQFSRLLRECVECYGTELTHCKYSLFYYPINTLDSLLFGQYVASFCAPIVTTPSIESALIATDCGNGYILELTEYDSRLTCFNLNFLSKNICKEQLLFCGGALPLRLVNIRQVALEKNYGKYVSALSVLDTLISGKRPNEKPSNTDLKLINQVLKVEANADGGNDKQALGEYITNLFEYYVIYAKRVVINFYWFDEYYQAMQGLLTRKDTPCMPMLQKIVQIFSCCEYLGIENGHQGIEANEGYLKELLQEMSKLEAGQHELKQIELLNAKFEEQVVFGDFMEQFFNAGFDVNIEKKKYDKSLLFKVVE